MLSFFISIKPFFLSLVAYFLTLLGLIPTFLAISLICTHFSGALKIKSIILSIIFSLNHLLMIFNLICFWLFFIHFKHERFIYWIMHSYFMTKKHKKSNVAKEKLIAEIKEAMKDPEIRKGIKQFVRATSCWFHF